MSDTFGFAPPPEQLLGERWVGWARTQADAEARRAGEAARAQHRDERRLADEEVAAATKLGREQDQAMPAGTVLELPGHQADGRETEDVRMARRATVVPGFKRYMVGANEHAVVFEDTPEIVQRMKLKNVGWWQVVAPPANVEPPTDPPAALDKWLRDAAEHLATDRRKRLGELRWSVLQAVGMAKNGLTEETAAEHAAVPFREDGALLLAGEPLTAEQFYARCAAAVQAGVTSSELYGVDRIEEDESFSFGIYTGGDFPDVWVGDKVSVSVSRPGVTLLIVLLFTIVCGFDQSRPLRRRWLRPVADRRGIAEQHGKSAPPRLIVGPAARMARAAAARPHRARRRRRARPRPADPPGRGGFTAARSGPRGSLGPDHRPGGPGGPGHASGAPGGGAAGAC